MESDVLVGEQLQYKDRKTGLVLFGILEIGAGVLLALFIPLAIFGATMRSSMCRSSSTPPAAGQVCATAPIDAKMMIPTMMVPVLASVWLITMGIGSIRCRRWARALVLVSASFGLIAGIVGMCMVAVVIPNMLREMPNRGGAPAAAFVIGMLVFPLRIYVVLPGLTVLFYKSKHVKATVEHRDPQIRWTDRCPLPVLAITLICALSVISSLIAAIMVFFGVGMVSVLPFFGKILTGPAVIAWYLVFVALMGYVGLGSYKLDRRAWWVAMIVAIVLGISAVVSACCLSQMDLWEKMDLPAAQMEAMQKFSAPQQSCWTFAFGVIWSVVAIGYLLYVKRYFKRGEARDEIAS